MIRRLGQSAVLVFRSAFALSCIVFDELELLGGELAVTWRKR